MNYVSTRGGTDPVGFSSAVITGLAADGGLLLPAEMPSVGDRLAAWRKLSYVDLAFEIMRLYTDIPEGDLRDLIKRSYSVFRHGDVAPVVRVRGIHILELFHGPTLSFKDIALQFLGNLFEYLLDRAGRELNIVAATSGDTGSAAIHGIRGRDRMRIFVMHPHGKISPSQERQMTSVLDRNVFNMAVRGTFDDCQQILKGMFRDLEFKKRYSLGSVNSINWARVLAQIVYYFYGAFRVMDMSGAERVRFAVPTGNFGDIFSGYVAWRMGLPISRLVLATNENDILARFFASGIYERGRVYETMSPSMDIQVASNFERYIYCRVGGDGKRVRALMEDFSATGRMEIAPSSEGEIDRVIVAGRGDTEATMRTIGDTYSESGYVLDPHTAVGVCVAGEHMAEGEPMICLATAHPAKFGEAIRRATGRVLARHEVIDGLTDLPVRCKVLPADEALVRRFVSEAIEGQ